MLRMDPGCKECDADLDTQATSAFICSLECTYCQGFGTRMKNMYPNYGGVLSSRPGRDRSIKGKYPPSANRIFRPSSRTTSEE